MYWSYQGNAVTSSGRKVVVEVERLLHAIIELFISLYKVIYIYIYIYIYLFIYLFIFIVKRLVR